VVPLFRVDFGWIALELHRIDGQLFAVWLNRSGGVISVAEHGQA